MSIQFTYQGYDRVPGISARIDAFENEFMFGPWPAQFKSGLVISGDAADSGNTGNTNILRAGLLLGLNISTEELDVWDPTAADGTEYIFGVLARTINVHNISGAGQDRLSGPIMIGGGLLAERLIIGGETDMDINGKTHEYIARQMLRGRFILNDSFQFGRPEEVMHTVTSAEQTAGITLAVTDSHRHYYNTGGTITITLPSTAYRGIQYKFTAPVSTTDNITISSGSSNILDPGSSAASSLTVDGATRLLRGNGTNWLVEDL